MLETSDKVSRDPNPSSDRNATETGLAEERKRKGEWEAGGVPCRLKLPKPVGAVHGSVWLTSRQSSVRLEGSGSAGRSRRVTFVGTGATPPEKVMIFFVGVSAGDATRRPFSTEG